MLFQRKNVWIVIAGISKRIKNNTPPPHWRCRIDGNIKEEHLLMGWTLTGMASMANNRQRTNPTASEGELSAWVEYFGDITIDDRQWATIVLQEPSF